MVSLYGTFGVWTFTSMPYLSFQFLERDIPMQLPHGAEDHLMRLDVADELEGGVLLDEFGEPQAHLFHIRLDLGSRANDRSGRATGLGDQERGTVVSERVTGLGILELGDRHDIAGHRLLDGSVFLPHRVKEPPALLLDIARGIEKAGIRRQRPGVHPQVIEPSMNGSMIVLKTYAAKGAPGSGTKDTVSLPSALVA